MTPGLFIGGTGTGIGKTFVTRALARALRRDAGRDVVALKPLETGCAPDPLDALAIGRAAGQPPALARHHGLYRASLPVAPYAATLSGHPAPPDPEQLAVTCRHLAERADALLIEGAGGILVPLDGTRDLADLVALTKLPVLLVAPDGLGVLSHTLTAAESLRLRAVDLAGAVLTTLAPPSSDPDPSRATNLRILEERLDPAPVLAFPYSPDDDERLADAAVASGLLELALRALEAQT